MSGDVFQLAQIAVVQGGILEHLAKDETDIAIKIAALRATADLMTHAALTASLAAQLAAAFRPKR